MASFEQQASLAQDPAFVKRVAMAALAAAQAIANETVTVATQEYHRIRQGLAFGALNDPMSVAQRFAYVVAANPAITAESSDSDIQFTVNAAWNSMAGIPQSMVPPSP